MPHSLSFEEGLRLFQFAQLSELQSAASAARFEKHPNRHVTFVLDSNPNYTNICNIDCSFCAFYRKPHASDAYFKTPEEVMNHLAFAREAGLTTVLLQGGVHEGITIDYLETLVRMTRERFPDVHPHFYSAVEIWNAAKVSGISVKEALQRLWDAGQRTIPGGGAEILSESVRLKVSPKKIGPNGWIDLHVAAHEIGFKTTATMMYGHVESPEDILVHLDALRSAQEVHGGFTSFIPWSYKPDFTALRHRVRRWVGLEMYFRIIAIARLYLDNFLHIGGSWFGEGKQDGPKSLHYGADDFGGITLEENVHRATGFINKTDHSGIVKMIRESGFIPVQRNSFYEVIKVLDADEEVVVPEAGRVKEQDRVEVLYR